MIHWWHHFQTATGTPIKENNLYTWAKPERQSQMEWLIDSSWQFKNADKNFRFWLTIMSKSECVSSLAKAFLSANFVGLSVIYLVYFCSHSQNGKNRSFEHMSIQSGLDYCARRNREAAKYVGRSLKIFWIINSVTIFMDCISTKNEKKMWCLKWNQVRWAEKYHDHIKRRFYKRLPFAFEKVCSSDSSWLCQDFHFTSKCISTKSEYVKTGAVQFLLFIECKQFLSAKYVVMRTVFFSLSKIRENQNEFESRRKHCFEDHATTFKFLIAKKVWKKYRRWHTVEKSYLKLWFN